MVKRKTFPDELIGEEAEVIDSRNKSNVGIKGKIVDETKMTLTLQSSAGKKTLLKSNVILKLKDGRRVSGEQLTGRPEDRIARG